MAAGKTYWADAPASTMLFGEHAVLAGYPAMVMAVDYRLKIKVQRRRDLQIHIDALGEKLQALNAYDYALDRKFKYISAALRGLSIPLGLNIVIDSQIDSCVGLGSSSALLIALVAVLDLVVDGRVKPFEIVHQRALQVLHQVQGRGSGADLAACFYGGVIVYTMLDGVKGRLKAPNSSMHLIYSGYKTPTGQVLDLLHERVSSGICNRKSIDELGRICQRAIVAWQEGDLDALAHCCDQHHVAMQQLMLSDATLDAIYTHLRADGIMAKISGSGLGDCILAWHPPLDALPYRKIPAPCAHQGLEYGIF